MKLITTIIAISTLSACGLFRDHKAEERDQHARQVKSPRSKGSVAKAATPRPTAAPSIRSSSSPR